MSRAKELTKNTVIITIGKLSTQFMSFLLLPLYTYLLEKDDYGTIDFVNTLIQLLIPIVSVMIDQAAFRFLLEKNEEKDKIISNSMFILVVNSILVCISNLIIALFYHYTYAIWITLILIAMSINNLLLQIARGEKRTVLFSLGTFLCSATTIIMNVICIAILRTGAIGMLLATLSGNVLCAIFLFFKLKTFNNINIKSVNKNTMKKLVKYSIPLVPNQLSLWIMNSSDRIIVTAFLGAAANGVLAITHKFPSIYMTFYGIFLIAWQEFVAIHYWDKDRNELFTKMMNTIFQLFFELCIGIILVLPIVFDIMIGPNYKEAFYNIPIYMTAFLFNVIIGILGAVYVANKKTFEIVKTTAIAAVLNVLTCILLINIIGLYAASISTFLGYFIAMFTRIIDTKKYIKIKFEYKKSIELSIILLFSCVLYYIHNIIISIVTTIIYALYCLISSKKIILIGINFLRKKSNGENE